MFFKALNLRLASLVSVVSLTGLAGSDGGIVNKLEKMLAKASNDGELLAMLTESIKLISESRLELLTGDVGQLCLGNQRFGFGADKLLLKNDNARAVGLLVLELSDLIGNLLLACQWKR